jgi:hypothetical protein
MNGDTLCSKLLGIQSNLDQVGVVTAPAVPDGGYFVDVDGEAGHGVEGVEVVEVGVERCREVK